MFHVCVAVEALDMCVGCVFVSSSDDDTAGGVVCGVVTVLMVVMVVMVVVSGYGSYRVMMRCSVGRKAGGAVCMCILYERAVKVTSSSPQYTLIHPHIEHTHTYTLPTHTASHTHTHTPTWI